MKQPAKAKVKKQQSDSDETLRTIRHDIKNQLSNIQLALEQLRYEVANPTEDCVFYMDAIGLSAIHIDAILKKGELPPPEKI